MPSYFFLVWIVLIGLMFYFMMIKPAKRQRSAQFDMLQHMAVGSEVRTNANIMGTVTEIDEDFVVIETTPGVKIKFGKAAVVAIILPDEPAEEAVEDDGGHEHETLTGVVDAVPATVSTDDRPAPVQDAVPAAVEAKATTVVDKAANADNADNAEKVEKAEKVENSAKS